MNNRKHYTQRSDSPPQPQNPVNEKIKDEKLRVIDQDGHNVGVISRDKALSMAKDVNLDLVLISKNEKQGTSVAKIMDYGKFLYEKKKKFNEAKKHQKVVQIKEIKVRPTIGDQDYNVKIKQAQRFLKDGKKVKFTIQFRSRQVMLMSELGEKIFSRIHDDLKLAGLGPLVEEKESKSKQFWSKIVSIKGK